MLVDLAAAKLAVAGRFADGRPTASSDAPIGLKVTYGEIAAQLDLKREATGKVAPKPASAHKIVGQSTPRLDIPGKVTGRISYVQDIFEAGMVHGRVVRPPRYGSTLESVDEAAVKSMPGVIKVVRDGSFLGVVAEREEQAIKAREALAKAAKWKLGPELPDPANIHAHLKSLPSKDEVIGVKQAPALASGRTRTHEATYTKPYLAHGSIGPSCAMATFLNGRMIVWTHSQGVFPLRDELAKALKMPAKDIRCIHVEGSGCYGQNGADDVALDAALLARAVPGQAGAAAMDARRRVRLGAVWRGDVDERQGVARTPRARSPTGSTSCGATPIRCGRRAPTAPTCWRPGTWPSRSRMARRQGIPQPAGGGDRNAIPLYDFPNQKIVHHFIPEMPIRVSALRTLGAYANVFAVESFMDEMAALAKADPVAFRLAHLKDPRARAVIEKVAAMASWKPGEAGSLGRGRGIGFAKYKNLACYVACIADVEIDRASGKVRVPQRLGGGRCRAGHQSGRAEEPDRGRHHPVGELDAVRAGALRQERHPVARLGELSDHDDAGRAQGHGRADQPAERAFARRGRRLAGPGGGGDRQRGRARDRQAAARPAARRRPRQGGAGLTFRPRPGWARSRFVRFRANRREGLDRGHRAGCRLLPNPNNGRAKRRSIHARLPSRSALSGR